MRRRRPKRFRASDERGGIRITPNTTRATHVQHRLRRRLHQPPCQGARKYTCRFLIGIENDKDFQVARRLIGSKGSNMKRIVRTTEAESGGDAPMRARTLHSLCLSLSLSVSLSLSFSFSLCLSESTCACLRVSVSVQNVLCTRLYEHDFRVQQACRTQRFQSGRMQSRTKLQCAVQQAVDGGEAAPAWRRLGLLRGRWAKGARPGPWACHLTRSEAPLLDV